MRDLEQVVEALEKLALVARKLVNENATEYRDYYVEMAEAERAIEQLKKGGKK